LKQTFQYFGNAVFDLYICSIKNILMDAEKIIDLDILRNICGEDVGYIKEIIDLFLLQTPAMVDEIDAAFADNNIELLKKKAHKLKSSASMFGIEKLIVPLHLLEETDIGKSSKKEIRSLLKNVRKLTETAFRQIKEVRKNYD